MNKLKAMKKEDEEVEHGSSTQNGTWYNVGDAHVLVQPLCQWL